MTLCLFEDKKAILKLHLFEDKQNGFPALPACLKTNKAPLTLRLFEDKQNG